MSQLSKKPISYRVRLKLNNSYLQVPGAWLIMKITFLLWLIIAIKSAVYK